MKTIHIEEISWEVKAGGKKYGFITRFDKSPNKNADDLQRIANLLDESVNCVFEMLIKESKDETV